MRMCDIIRNCGLTDAEVREALSPSFPPARISEILRVTHAPKEIYIRYQGGFFGFKAALRECRGYMVTPTEELRRRKIRRAGERLVKLLEQPTKFMVRGKLIAVTW